MNLESLKTKVTEAGGTQFSALSERTIDHMLSREISRNDSDEYYTDDVINSIVADLKEFDGNLHFEVGRKNTEYKTKFEEEWKKTHPDTKPTSQDEDKLSKILAKMEAQEKKLQEIEDARKQSESKMKKEQVLESVKKSLNAKFKEANVDVNAYILKQTLRDIEIPDENADVKAISKAMETAYYKNLKDAGLEISTPRFGGSGGGKGNTAASDFFARKAKREGWAKESK